MRVLHCHSGNLFGGIERSLLALAAAPPASLVSDFALCFEGRMADELRAARHSVKILGRVRYRLPWTLWRARRRLMSYLTDTKPDWVLTHSMWSLRLAYPVARQCQIPVGIWVHDAFQGRSWLEHPGSFSPDKIFANSQFTSEHVPRVFPGRWPELLSPPLQFAAVDESARARVRAELEATRETVVLLIAGRFEPLKGHALLLKALTRASVQLPSSVRWALWIAGSAQRPEEAFLKTQLETQAASLGGRVKFLGHRSDIASLYSAADVYCQPNTGPESFGLTFAEAAAAGLPIVTTRLGAAPEIVDNRNGRLVPPGDEAALSNALTELLGSADLRRGLGNEGKSRAKRFSSGKAAAERMATLLQGGFVSRIVGV